MKSFLSKLTLTVQAGLALAYTNNLIPAKYAAYVATALGVIQAFQPRVQQGSDAALAADITTEKLKSLK